MMFKDRRAFGRFKVCPRFRIRRHELLIVIVLLSVSAYGARNSRILTTAFQGLTPTNEMGAQGPSEPLVVTVSVHEDFFNGILEAMLALPNPPAISLSPGHVGEAKNGSSDAPNGCAGEITLLREMDGVRTAVHLKEGQIIFPVAFRGNFNAGLVGCPAFEGWADTSISLPFDTQRQALTARITVREVHVKGLPALIGNGLSDLVQRALDARINPVELLRTDQLMTRVPDGHPDPQLRLRARKINSELLPGELRLHIIYDIVGAG